MGKQEKFAKRRKLDRELLALWKRGQSKYCEVRQSDIHGSGVYATKFIPKDTRIIEYLGELITKEESDKRGIRQHKRSEKTGDAAVFIFTLTKQFDIDGNVPWNTARLINHSCDPNCEAYNTGRRIYIHAQRDIEAGEELSFDYGFDIEHFEEHPCRCGTDNCVGYIVSRDQWDELKEQLAKRENKRRKKNSA